MIIENHEKQEAEDLSRGYQKTDEVISIVKANVMVFVTAGPFIILGVILWIVLKGSFTFLSGLNQAIAFLVLFFISIFIHECLHGLGWMMFAKGGRKSIHIGIMKESMTPYCHCKEPLKPLQYLVGALLPFMLLGVLLYIAAFVLGSGLLLMLSLTGMLIAGGDTTIVMNELKYLSEKDCYILDHPTDCGFVVFNKVKQEFSHFYKWLR